jgi:predicted nucleotidyltransferase
MKVLGIITEYNPFHNGHLYHIQKSKELTKTDFVVLVMSGNFTQSGNIALINKFERAKIACKYGIDLVIELPTVYATSSAEYFAKGAINILNNLGIVDCICFGAEESNIDNLKYLTDILVYKEDLIFKYIKEELKQGINFPKARELAISKILKETNTDYEKYLDIISKPNNILGIEYLKSLKKLNSNITPYLIERGGSTLHNQEALDGNIHITSATSIRKKLEKNSNFDLSSYIPEYMNNIIKESSICTNNDLFKILKYKITIMSEKDLSEINEITEGLENRIKKANNTSKNYNELVENIKSKRYTETKIKRILIAILLGITKENFKKFNENNISYAHILAMSENGKKLMSEISKKSDSQIFTSIKDEILQNNEIDKNILESLNLDILATNTHSIIADNNLNLDYTNRLN